MKERAGVYKFPLMLAILLHLLLLIALLWHFIPEMRMGQGPQTQIINASLVNPKKVAAQPSRIIAPEPVKEKPVVHPPKPVMTKPPMPHPVRPVSNNKAVAEAAALQQAKDTQLQQLKQAKIAAQQKLAQQKAEKQKAAQQKAEKQRQLAKQIQADQQKLLQQQLAQEQQQLSQAAASAAQDKAWRDEMDKYKALIVQAISQNWIIPDGIDKNLTCVLLIQMGPDGTVLSVQVAQSSGNEGLDNSAVNAVYKSSPLPVPKDPKLVDQFRQLRLAVKPQNIN